MITTHNAFARRVSA